MNRKKTWTVALGALLIFLLCACSSGTSANIIGLTENTSEHDWTMEYDEFTGSKTRKFVVQPGTLLHMSLEMEHESGTMTMSILDKEGNTLVTINQDESELVTGRMFVEGTYIVKLTGDKHEGSTRVAFTTETDTGKDA